MILEINTVEKTVVIKSSCTISELYSTLSKFGALDYSIITSCQTYSPIISTLPNRGYKDFTTSSTGVLTVNLGTTNGIKTFTKDGNI